jgi:hypothetical protein
MDVSLVAALIGVAAGAFGYWFATFAVQPILLFKEIRSRIHAEFIYYAQVINEDGLNDEMKILHRERILANRKSSADLSAAYINLPSWYKFCLSHRSQTPQVAVRHLIGYSNTTDYKESHNLEDAIKKSLNLPREI